VFIVMKLLSWNVRGLGGAVKKREVSHLVREKKPFILCIQETKLQVLDAFDCRSIWGDDKVDFSYQRSAGASGGLVTLWDLSEVEVWSSASLDHVLAVTGRFLKSGEQFTMFNVYAPCDTSVNKPFGLPYLLGSKLWRAKMFVFVGILMPSGVRQKEEV